MSPELKAELVELAYDLLTEERAVELRARIANEPETAALYEEVQRKASLIADASRVTLGTSMFDSCELRVASCELSVNNSQQNNREQAPTQAVARHRPPATSRSPRNSQLVSRNLLFNRIMTSAAACLVVLAICGYAYQRHQLSRVAETSCNTSYNIVAVVPVDQVTGDGEQGAGSREQDSGDWEQATGQNLDGAYSMQNAVAESRVRSISKPQQPQALLREEQPETAQTDEPAGLVAPLQKNPIASTTDSYLPNTNPSRSYMMRQQFVPNRPATLPMPQFDGDSSLGLPGSGFPQSRVEHPDSSVPEPLMLVSQPSEVSEAVDEDFDTEVASMSDTALADSSRTRNDFTGGMGGMSGMGGRSSGMGSMGSMGGGMMGYGGMGGGMSAESLKPEAQSLSLEAQSLSLEAQSLSPDPCPLIPAPQSLAITASAKPVTQNDQTIWQVDIQVSDENGLAVADAEVVVQVLQTPVIKTVPLDNHTFGMIVLFGGVGLAGLSMILLAMRLASRMRMIVVATVSGLTCVFVCLVMLRGQSDPIIRQWDESAKYSAFVKQVIPVDRSVNAGYPNFAIRTDIQGRASFKVTFPSIGATPYLIIDAVSQDGQVGVLHQLFMEF